MKNVISASSQVIVACTIILSILLLPLCATHDNLLYSAMLVWSCRAETLKLGDLDVAKIPFPPDSLQILQYITPSSLLNCNQS